MKIAYMSFLVLLTSLTSCGPIYSTEYRFIPPPDASGSRCVDKCEDDRDYCKRYASEEKEYCERLNQREMDECNERIFRDKNRKPKIYECGRQRYCPDGEADCDREFRACYQSCGGDVREEQVCVMNCAEVGAAGETGGPQK